MPQYPRPRRTARRAALFLGAALSAYAVFCAGAAVFLGIPPVPDSTVILDRYGARVGEIPLDGKIRHVPAPQGGWTEFARAAAEGLEDRRRAWHAGVDPLAAASAAWALASGGRRGGASTLEAQLLRNRLWPDAARDWSQKLKETALAPAVRLKLGRRGVTDAWLDSVPFGNLCYGLEAAAWTYFGKSSANLTQAETVALLSIPNNPSAFDPIRRPQAWRGRFERASAALRAAGVVTADERAAMLAEPLDFYAGRDAATLPYLRDAARAAGLSGTVRTTVDAGLSEKVSRLALKTVASMAWRDVTDAAVVVTDRATMEVRVLVGGVGYETKAGQVNSVFAARQAGSTLKPFTYLLAFRDLGMTPASTVLDEPVEYKTDKGYGYAPRNYSNSFEGAMTAGRALAESVNVPAVRLAAEVGLEKLLAFLRQAGFTTLDQPADHYGLALTLGAGDVRLWDLVQAYGVFPNGGRWCPMTFAEGGAAGPAAPCFRLADEKFADMVADSLTRRELKIGGFPVGGTLDFPDRRVAVKTGTSRNFVDNWAVGWTDRYLVGVWVGNKDGAAMKGVSGATGAGDLFAAVVRLLEPESAPDETADAAVLPPAPSAAVTVTSPLPGSTYLADPAVPAARAKVGLKFSTGVPYDAASWSVDGRPVPDALWPLAPGAHEAAVTLTKGGETVGSARAPFVVETP